MGWLKGESLALSRGNTDKYGERHKADAGTIEGIFAWTAPFKKAGIANGRSQDDGEVVQLYVKRDVDLRARDELVRANGQKYVVQGRAQWDQDHPYDGYDFGYKVFYLEALNAAKG